jgi:oligosaccharide reducing-end xylanase
VHLSSSRLFALVLTVGLVSVGCGGGVVGGPEPVAGTGGSPGTGGTGSHASTGGSSPSGGSPSTGGISAGGKPATGGNNSSGGKVGTGGKGGSGSGGTMSTGGTINAGGSSAMTIPGNGCTPPASYANLFVTLSGHTQAETDAKVAAAWNQLFSTSGANTVFYNGPGSDESYVKDVANNDVRTEGMSYGMMIAVQLDHQMEFDRLWAFVKKHMAQSSGQYAWHTSTSGSPLATGGAPDGDEYFATALIFAAKRWGATSGKFDYAAEAQPVLKTLRTLDFNQNAKIVAFYSGSGNTDGSYVLPAFYQTWACFDTANQDFWNGAVTAGRAFFKAAANSNGVIPDQSSFSGAAQGGAGSDAVRCVMNVMMDHNFFNADPWQTTYATEFGAYSKNGGGATAGLACNGLLGFGLPASTGKPFVDKLWSVAIPTGNYRYYDGTLYMLGLLHVSGMFHLWY